MGVADKLSSMVNSVMHAAPLSEANARRATVEPPALQPATDEWMENLMAKLMKSAIATVTCATPKTTETVDGKLHKMVRYVPIAVPEGLKDGTPIDEKIVIAALRAHVARVQAMQNGEAIDVYNAKGELEKTLKPTDSIPTKSVESKKEIKNKAGVVTGVEVTINHGVNMGKTQPGQVTKDDPTGWASVLNAFNDGLAQAGGIKGRGDIVAEVRAGDGTRGRKGAEVNLEEAE